MFWLVALSLRTRLKPDCCCCCCCCWEDFVSAAAAAAAAAAAPMLPIPSGSLACCCCCGLSLTESNFSSFPLAFPRKINYSTITLTFPYIYKRNISPLLLYSSSSSSSGLSVCRTGSFIALRPAIRLWNSKLILSSNILREIFHSITWSLSLILLRQPSSHLLMVSLATSSSMRYSSSSRANSSSGWRALRMSTDLDGMGYGFDNGMQGRF